MSNRIPVTVITGFLGSGKTTLLNRVLSEQHGQRFAVIENEFGEIGVDQELVINADEEIFEMNNGCICCTVRGDLIRILGNLAKRRDRFDRILLETTGLADPGPVAQTFFVDDEIRDAYFIDGIITLVDAVNAERHLDDSDEALAQIAFADRILLNKTDLAETGAIEQLRQRLAQINSAAAILPVQMANAPLDSVLDIGGFDLSRALEKNPQFLEPEYPFEWGGVYRLPAGAMSLCLQPGPDPAMSLVIAPMEAATEAALTEGAERIFPLFSMQPEDALNGATVSPGNTHWNLCLEPDTASTFTLQVPHEGLFALFTQHRPDEFAMTFKDGGGVLLQPLAEHDFNPDHEHDDSVSSVSLEFDGALNGEKLNQWLSILLQTQGTDIFRMKGILNLAGEDVRLVFQGVHMLLDAQPGPPWGAERRYNRMVFIGRNLDADYLQLGFESCLAPAR